MKSPLPLSALIGFALILSACTPAPTPPATSFPQPTPSIAAVVLPTGTQPFALNLLPPPPGPTATLVVDTVTPAPTATRTPVPASAITTPTTLTVAQNPEAGAYLTGTNGMTVYLYILDPPGTTTCYAACAADWPPVLTSGAPVAGAGVNPTYLGTIQHADGSTQVTYNFWPLYYYSRDTNPGDVNGEEMANTFYLIAPDGTQR